MKFQGTKVSYKSPLGQEHTTWYHHGPHQNPTNRIELDVTRYGLKVHSIEKAVVENLVIKGDNDLVMIR